VTAGTSVEHVASPAGTLAYRLRRLLAPLTRWFDGGNPLTAYGRYIAGTAVAGR
jgi:hypothetical protein